MNAMTLNAMNRALLPAAVGALLCGSAFGQVGAGGAGGGILGDRGVREASRSRPRLLVEYTTSGGAGGKQKLTIDAAGNADLVEEAAPSAASVHLEPEEVAGLENAIAPIRRLPPRTRPHGRRDAFERTLVIEQAGALVPIRVDDDDATMAVLTDWLDDIAKMALGGAFADSNKVLEVKVVRPDRRSLSVAGVIYTRDTPSAVPYEIDRTGRRRMLAARRIGADEMARLHALWLLADHDDVADAATPAAAAIPGRRARRLGVRMWDSGGAAADATTGPAVEGDAALILPILPGGDLVHLLGS